MKRGKELLSNTIIIAIGNFGTKIISFFLLPLYTSMLSTKEYGVYDLLITISIFIVPFITMLMEESMFRFLIDSKDEKEKRMIISQTMLFCLINIIIFTILYFFIGMLINIPYMLIFYLYIISSVISSLKNALTRGTSQIKMYATSNFLSSLIIIILNIIFIAIIKTGISGLLLSYILGNTIVSILVFFKLRLFNYISYKDIEKETMKKMLNYSIPLVPNSLSWTIINLSDRIIISSVIGTSANGIYSISYKFPTLIDTIYGFFYTAWKESAAKSLKDDDSEEFYNKIYNILKNFIWSIVIMMICTMPFVFNLFIKKEFVDAFLYIPILVISMYFSNISGYYGGIFAAFKNTKVMGITTIIAAVINVIINLLLIKNIGIWAAALSTLCATATIYLYRKIKIKEHIKLEENGLNTFLSIISVIIACTAYYSENIFLQVIIFLILGIYCCVINKETVKTFYLIFLKNKIKHTN